MKSEWIDITVTIRTGMVHWPGDPAVEVKAMKVMDNGDSSNVSLLSMGSHTGTHMDAPRHFFSNGTTLDNMPLDATVGPARVIAIKDQECIGVAELEEHALERGERILFKTRNSSLWKTGKFDTSFVYITPDAAQYLAQKGVRTVGVDYLSVGGYKKNGTATHQALLGAGVWLIEGLDLSPAEPGEYDIVCLPLKIIDSDGAPARAIMRVR